MCQFLRMDKFSQIVSCECGQVEFQASAKPIVTAVCYCDDCQTAGEIIDKLQNVKPFREEDGGTPYVTLHDKNWERIKGQELLEPFKLTPNSPTTRYVTTCCRSPLFIKFKSGFWTSTYRARYVNPPKLEWRNKVGKRLSKLPFADDIPRYKGYPLQLFGRLIKAWF